MKGEIILYPVIISSSTLSQKIEIEVTPESNDIVAKESLYIVLDTTGKSVLTLKEDLISSGSNRSELTTYHLQVSLAAKSIHDKRMSDKKVKISNILEFSDPEFIQSESPLFKEFLEQYYISEEREYGTTYLADNIDTLKKIDRFGRLNYAAVVITLTEEIFNLDETINVNTTAGCPDKYGILKIDNEIITYTGKTATSFTGCVRGFSGIDKLEGI